MVTTQTSHRAAPPRRPPGLIRQLLGWFRRRPLVVGVTVVAAVTLTASAYQNAQGRADNAPPSAAAPTLDDCPTFECSLPGEDADSESKTEDMEASGDAGADTGAVPTQTPPPAPAGTEARQPGTGPRAWPLVRSGAEGETVAAIQLLLTAHGYGTEADAVFGPATTAQVTSYQRDRSLAVDGIVGPDTWHALIVNVRAGDRGPAVMAGQRLLTAHGQPVANDGVFSQKTTQAVTAFQTEQHLAADGIVGPDTWSALVNLG
jgi:peptidoglycan hydrolase-like protein with peptidoglycan-binding domain